MNTDDFSEWLADAMEEKDIGIMQLAREAGVSCMTIRHYLKGNRSPSLVILQPILDVLGKKIVFVDK